MKIDIHTHTKKIKSGDPDTRNVDLQKFTAVLKNTDVKILAITNHNHFDLVQFQEFSKSMHDSCMIWPGVELDIMESGNRAHLIVIANPKEAKAFDTAVGRLIGKKSADQFTTSLDEVVNEFKVIDCLYIAHYLVKKPSLGDAEIEKLEILLGSSKRILKEATNSTSAGIYITHGHNSIFGSDIQDWDLYEEQATFLPELRLPVESFEQFCLLLEKDEATINTLLNKKIREEIQLNPFGPAELLNLSIYNDINILFGSKGTGKTAILESLSKYYNSKGYKTAVYSSSDTHLNTVFDIKGSRFVIELPETGIDGCEEQIQLLKDVEEVEITSVTKYLQHFAVEETNKLSKKIKIKSIQTEDYTVFERLFLDAAKHQNTLQHFEDYLIQSLTISDYIDEPTISKLKDALSSSIDQLRKHAHDRFLESKEIQFMNHFVQTFQHEIAKKTGRPQKPSKTGFKEYAKNRMAIERAILDINLNMKKIISPRNTYAGSMGDKGELYCQTNIVIQDGSISNSQFSSIRKNFKTTQKAVGLTFGLLHKHVYKTSLFEKISELNDLDQFDEIESLKDLLQFHRQFILNDVPYQPSAGESSMILLHKELKEEKEIYLIDEPEKSLGNDYINDVIVPLLKDKALLGSKVIIATHDANIAVRTLPYNSIYRKHEGDRYFTLTGNPFANKLKCINQSIPDMDWKETSMKTLEGGRDAFGERGKIYGN